MELMFRTPTEKRPFNFSGYTNLSTLYHVNTWKVVGVETDDRTTILNDVLIDSETCHVHKQQEELVQRQHIPTEGSVFAPDELSCNEVEDIWSVEPLAAGAELEGHEDQPTEEGEDNTNSIPQGIETIPLIEVEYNE